MAKERVVNLAFPLAGLDRRMPYPQQPPYSTPDALNVRPMATIEKRARGGSRPGLARLPAPQLGSGLPVRMLNTVRYATDLAADAFEVWEDAFAGHTMGAAWAATTWTATRAIALGNRFQGEALVAEYADGLRGGIITQASELHIHAKSTSIYELLIIPHRGQFGGIYKLYAKLLQSGASYADPDLPGGRGFRVLVNITTGGVITGSVIYQGGGDTVQTTNFSGTQSVDSVGPQLLQLIVTWNGTDSYEWTVKLGTQTLATYTAGTAFNYTNNYGCGFAIKALTATDTVKAELFRVRYKEYYSDDETTDDPDQKPVVRNALVVAAGATLYAEQPDGTFSTILGGLPPDGRYGSVEYEGNLYVAYYDKHKLVKQSLLAAGCYINHNFIVMPQLTDEEFARIDPGNLAAGDRIQISFGIPTTDMDNGIEGMYRITNASNVFEDDKCKLTLGKAESWADDPNWTLDDLSEWLTHDPRITIFGSKPLRFGLESGSIVRWGAEAGFVPYGCHIVSKYRSRIVLAGYPATWWYMSRMYNPKDWDYGQTDSQRAVAWVLSDAGAAPQPITALIPYEDDMLIFGCTASIWGLRGDPTYGGKLDAIHSKLGIVGANAWTLTPDGWLIVLTQAGLMSFSPSAVLASGKSQLTPMLKESLPRELINVDPNQYTVLMSFDHDDDGIHLFLTPKGQAKRLHWWIDWGSKSIWPVDLPAAFSPTALIDRREADVTSENGIILGGSDGYLRRFHNSAAKDETTEISSYILIGPFHTGIDAVHDGALMTLEATLAADSGDVTWEVFTGDSGEAAVSSASAAATGTWSEGLNYLSRPSARGPWAVLKISAKSGECKPWALERINARLRQLGMHRKL
jgi:hypothetical protein